jgi:hypothetical protein
MLPLVPPNDERAKEWEIKSLNLISVDGRFPAIVRALGRLDSFLRHEDCRAIEDADDQDVPNFNIIEDYLTLSQLWVFGAYELLRTLCETLKAGVPSISADARERTYQLQQKFARIRMPLAKLEPANNSKGLDELPKGVGVLAKAKEKGWFWQLNNTTYVWRRDLGDELLALLDLFPAPFSGRVANGKRVVN